MTHLGKNQHLPLRHLFNKILRCFRFADLIDCPLKSNPGNFKRRSWKKVKAFPLGPVVHSRPLPRHIVLVSKRSGQKPMLMPPRKVFGGA